MATRAERLTAKQEKLKEKIAEIQREIDATEELSHKNVIDRLYNDPEIRQKIALVVGDLADDAAKAASFLNTTVPDYYNAKNGK